MPRRHDALVSAKIALIGADRSLDALVVMPADDDDPRLGLLQAQLLRREVEARFPDARGVVRVGLDCAPNAVDFGTCRRGRERPLALTRRSLETRI